MSVFTNLSVNICMCDILCTVPASRSEYHHIKHQLEAENIPGESPGDPPRSFHSLPAAEQARLEKKRLAGEQCIELNLK